MLASLSWILSSTHVLRLQHDEVTMSVLDNAVSRPNSNIYNTPKNIIYVSTISIIIIISRMNTFFIEKKYEFIEAISLDKTRT